MRTIILLLSLLLTNFFAFGQDLKVTTNNQKIELFSKTLNIAIHTENQEDYISELILNDNDITYMVSVYAKELKKMNAEAQEKAKETLKAQAKEVYDYLIMGSKQIDNFIISTTETEAKFGFQWTKVNYNAIGKEKQKLPINLVVVDLPTGLKIVGLSKD